MIDSRAFRQACSKFATGITIAAVSGVDGRPHGMTVNSFTSVSMTPPLVLICIDKNANVIEHFLAASSFAVSILNDAQMETSNRFAARGQDRFLDTPWHAAESGAPLIDGALATFDTAVSQVVEAGDHVILIGEVSALTIAEGRPLLYFGSSYQSLA
jgi:flavin reductase (DIM6/NTAB) family NADH-FMN oxidoreductase RutF